MDVHRVEDTRGTGQCGTEGESEGDDGVAVHSHEGGRVSVLREGPQGEAEPGSQDGLPQGDQQEKGHRHDKEVVARDGHTLPEGNADRGQEVGKGLLIDPEEDLPTVGEQERNSDRGDEHCKLGLGSQRPIGETLDHDPEEGADKHRPNQDGRGRHPGIGKDPVQEGCPVVARKGPDHEDVAMGEVDELEDAVDHAVAECDQGVDGS